MPEDAFYHYLLQPGEEHNDKCKRVINRIWSKKNYRLSKSCHDVLSKRWPGEDLCEEKANAHSQRHRAVA